MRSARTDAANGDPATEFAGETIKGHGIDLSHHRSQRIGPWIDLALAADFDQLFGRLSDSALGHEKNLGRPRGQMRRR